MKLSHRLAIAGFLAVLTLSLAACLPNIPLCESTIHTVGDYQNGCGLSVSAGADSAQLDMQVQLKQGTLEWILTDPAGVVRWQGKAEAGEDTNLSRTFDNPAPGRWDLTFLLENAAGEYHAPWTVH